MEMLKKDYHDWYLVGIKTDLEKNEIDITLEINNECVKLCFINIKKCLINEFTLGNIILDIEVISGKNSSKLLSQDNYFLKLYDFNKNFYESVLEQIDSSILKYVEINPSYGCSVQIICENVLEIEN